MWAYLVIPAFDNECISFAPHNVDLGDEEAVDVPVEKEEYKRWELFKFILTGFPMLIFLVLFVYCYLPGDAPSHMVGNGRIAIVPPCWTNLGKEHSVLGFVTLDCRDEPDQVEIRIRGNKKGCPKHKTLFQELSHLNRKHFINIFLSYLQGWSERETLNNHLKHSTFFNLTRAGLG